MIGEYYGEGSLSVAFYDAVTSFDSNIKGDIEFYAGLMERGSGRVLEIGCGTGRVAIELAAKGHSVLGVDLSEPMLEVARRKSRSPLRAHLSDLGFLKHDMLKLDLPIQFDLVLLPYYTFNHLATRVLRARCLSVVAKHLLPGACAVIHAVSPEEVSRDRPERKRVVRLAGGLKSDEPARRLDVTWREPVITEREHRLTQVVEYELFSPSGERIAASIEELTLWWFSDFELITSATKVGLDHERTLTGFGPGPGRERIYLLRKL